MKTIVDDPEGFFEQGGWSFLEPEGEVRECGVSFLVHGAHYHRVARKCHVSNTKGTRPSGSLVFLCCFSRVVLQVDDKLGIGSHSDFFEIAKLFFLGIGKKFFSAF